MLNVTIKDATIPAIGFGTWELRGTTCENLVRAALDMGYRHIDTAQQYGNEQDVGKAIRASTVPRDQVFLTTKIRPDLFLPPFARRVINKGLRILGRGSSIRPRRARAVDFDRAIDVSLKALNVDHVDLLLLHWPSKVTPLEESLAALNRARERGLTRHIGVSNFPKRLMAEAVRLSDAPIVTNQVEYHPFLNQETVLRFTQDQDSSLTAHTPLAQGRGIGHPVLREIAERHKKSDTQVILRWLLQQPKVIAIPRTSKVENARSNLSIFDFALTAEEMRAVHGMATPDGRLVDFDFSPEWDPDPQYASGKVPVDQMPGMNT